MQQLAAVQLAEHFEDARDFAPRRAFGPAASTAPEVCAQVAMARVFEGETIEETPPPRWSRGNASKTRMLAGARGATAEVRLTQPAVEVRVLTLIGRASGTSRDSTKLFCARYLTEPAPFRKPLVDGVPEGHLGDFR